ncbi:MAG: MBOAT family O-acyltransferase [Pseudomonadota bacterium]
MLFNSLDYVVFLPVVVALYFLLPHRVRWVFLLAASYYFYMCWKAEYLVLIVVSTAIDYVAARGIAASSRHSRRRLWLALSLFSNLSILFGFKYFNFISAETRDLLALFNIFVDAPVFQSLLPVGISFYTFQTLSYTIDVYRGTQEVERHPGLFALYVAFFPQLVAGPIERSSRLLPQFRERHRFNFDRLVSGLTLIVWGFFKKLVVADRLALVADAVYGHPAIYQGGAIALGTLCFAYQIYCDFSGYTDIARGTARVLGIELMENFKRPYCARSISEFWHRWHISLSSWFRDYVYIPLGGNRKGSLSHHRNLAVVFVVSGLWHGANWTFVVWGALHYLYMAIERALVPLRERVQRVLPPIAGRWVVPWIQLGVTFCATSLAWVFFRSRSLAESLLVLTNLVQPSEASWWVITGVPLYELVVGGVAVLLLEVVQARVGDQDVGVAIASWSRPLRWSFSLGVVTSILIFGEFNLTAFIYFQF